MIGIGTSIFSAGGGVVAAPPEPDTALYGLSHLDANGYYVASAAQTLSTVTVVWVAFQMLAVSTAERRLVDFVSGTAGINLKINASEQVNVLWVDGTPASIQRTFGTVLTGTENIHLAMAVRDTVANQLRLTLDGGTYTSTAMTGVTMANVAHRFGLGNGGTVPILDNVRIFAVGYDAGANPDQAAATAYYAAAEAAIATGDDMPALSAGSVIFDVRSMCDLHPDRVWSANVGAPGYTMIVAPTATPTGLGKVTEIETPVWA